VNFPLLKYKFWIGIGLFLLWMTFFDNNSFVYRWRLSSDISRLEEGIQIHEKKIQELRRQKKELFGSQKNLEKFARERYLMKKENEDLFLIVDVEETDD